MEWLNYHHLLYFYTVAKEGSISKACRELRLAQPTISAQLKSLEDNLGEQLFERNGKRLALSPVGHEVYRYADQIFGLGKELLHVLKGRPTGRPMELVIGIADVVPKLIAYHLIRPALDLQEPVKIICLEDSAENLLAALAINQLNVVISDTPLSPAVKVKGYNHLLGECGVSFLAAPPLAKKYAKGFPQSLDGAPMLLPTEDTAVRRGLDQWFEHLNIRPTIIGEFEDSALLKMFGQAGKGIFSVPSAISQDAQRRFHASVVGKTQEVTERFYAISVERKLKHPAVVAICEQAANAWGSEDDS